MTYIKIRLHGLNSFMVKAPTDKKKTALTFKNDWYKFHAQIGKDQLHVCGFAFWLTLASRIKLSFLHYAQVCTEASFTGIHVFVSGAHRERPPGIKSLTNARRCTKQTSTHSPLREVHFAPKGVLVYCHFVPPHSFFSSSTFVFWGDVSVLTVRTSICSASNDTIQTKRQPLTEAKSFASERCRANESNGA